MFTKTSVDSANQNNYYAETFDHFCSSFPFIWNVTPLMMTQVLKVQKHTTQLNKFMVVFKAFLNVVIFTITAIVGTLQMC